MSKGKSYGKDLGLGCTSMLLAKKSLKELEFSLPSPLHPLLG